MSTMACLVIDDPLLRPRYGCIDYHRLLEEMKAHDFFTEIAFIPWNYRRSDPGTVKLFAENSDRYAICVHGCNHLDNEFGTTDYAHLCALSGAALWRMEQHKKLTGLPYDPVIVFPQGRFSSVAIKALKAQGYLAAFNSTIHATDTADPPGIEYQRPFTAHYHGFPVFLRRYPRDKARFADDLAAGRPIIVVEHHGAFRNGYGPVTDVVDWINELGDVRWVSLLDIAKHYLGSPPPPTVPATPPSHAHSRLGARTVLRRFLCEARDNYVETSNLLTKAYKMIRR